MKRDIQFFRSVVDSSEIVQGFGAFSKWKSAAAAALSSQKQNGRALSMATQPFLLIIDSGRLFCFYHRNEAHSIGGYMRLLFEMDKRDYDNCTHRFVRNSARSIIIREKKIAMIHSLKYDYYKFPGGGMEGEESDNQSF